MSTIRKYVVRVALAVMLASPIYGRVQPKTTAGAVYHYAPKIAWEFMTK